MTEITTIAGGKPVDAVTANAVAKVDPRRVTLALAAAWELMVELRAMSLDEAWDRLVERINTRCTDHRRRRQSAQPKPRPTPGATIEAIIVAVRERGLAALKEPANIARLGECDDAAKREINRRIARLKESSSHG